MKFDDDELEQYDDGEVFANTMAHVGQGMISYLFEYWKQKWPSMSEREFLPVLDGIRSHVGELLGPEQLSELWDWITWELEEHRKSNNPASKVQRNDGVLCECLTRWHEEIKDVKPPRRAPARKKKRK